MAKKPTDLNSVAFWMDVGSKFAIIESAVMFLPLIFLAPQTYSAIITAFGGGGKIEMISLAAVANPSSALNIAPITSVLAYWVIYLIANIAVGRLKNLLRYTIVKLKLWRTTSTIEQQTKYDYRIDKKTRELVDLVESKGYRLENPT